MQKKLQNNLHIRFLLANQTNRSMDREQKFVAKGGFDPPTSGLWAQRSSSGRLCFDSIWGMNLYIFYFQNAKFMKIPYISISVPIWGIYGLSDARNWIPDAESRTFDGLSYPDDRYFKYSSEKGVVDCAVTVSDLLKGSPLFLFPPRSTSCLTTAQLLL